MADPSPFRDGFAFVELYYDAAWHDITDDLSDGGFDVNRTVRDAATMTLALRNNTGRYSPRNPLSDLYGKIGRNTPIRAGVDMTGTDRRYLFWGVVASWPQRWERTGAPSAYAPIECSGVLRRLGQGASPLRSPLYRAITSLGPTLVGYWPLEDEDGATRFTSGLPTGRYATWAGTPTLATDDTWPGSAALPALGNASVTATPNSHAVTGDVQVQALLYVPAGTPTDARLMTARLTTSGTARVVNLYYAGSGNTRIEVLDADGVQLANGIQGADIEGTRFWWSIELTNSGSNISRTATYWKLGSTTGGTSFGSTITGASIGRCSSVVINPDRTSLGDLSVGHLTIESDITGLGVRGGALDGWIRETATDRISRLCTENGITFTTTGDESPAELMGVQGRDTLVALLDEAADAGQGFLFERADAAGLKYRTLPSLCAQTPALDIAYVDNLLRPFEPIDDDAATRNRVTVTRAGGGSTTLDHTDGPLGTDTVGVYDESLTLSLATEDLTDLHAGWRLSLGTVDEARWPTIGLHLADSYWLTDDTKTLAALAVDIGDRIRVTDLPAWLPPFPVDGLVTGITTAVRPLDITIELACSPAAPYSTGTYDGTARYSGDGTTTREDLDTTETGVDVLLPATLTGWGHDDGDYDVLIGGERMTVTAVGSVTVVSGERRQTLTVTRSVNGVVKTHTTGAAVTLAEPTKYAL